MTDATNIPALLEAQAAVHGDRIALVGNDGTGHYRTLSFVELHHHAARVAAALAALIDPERTGLDQRRVCWMYANANGLVATILYHAVVHGGGVNVPINPGSSADEVARLASSVDAAVVIAPTGTVPGLQSLSSPVIEIDLLDDLLTFAAAVPATGARQVQTGKDDPAVILFTSGTTGRSKGVVHSHGTAMQAGRGWAEAFDLIPDDVYQAMYPAYAGSSLHFSGLACLHSGTTYVIDETRPTAASLTRVDTYGTTVYAAVPSVFQYWLAEERSAYDLDTLRLLDFGGAVMHRSTIEALRKFVPGVRLIQTYGLTEAGPGGLYLPPEDLDRKLGSIGCKATSGLRFRLGTSAAEAARDDQPGQVGELHFAGTSIMLGYLDDPSATASVFDGEWMRTGDLVRVDPDGYVFFLDRLKDVIVRGGYNISSIEVEETLLGYHGIREVAAFGRHHADLGEVVAVAIVPDASSDLDLTDLHRFAREHLARVKVPEWITLVDTLPLTAAGKVDKPALRRHPGLARWEASER